MAVFARTDISIFSYSLLLFAELGSIYLTFIVHCILIKAAV